MKTVLSACLIAIAVSVSAQQDEFIGSYIRYLDEVTFETIIITDTEDCYAGQFGEGGEYDINLWDIEVGCYMDEDYFFLMISWDEYEFEISPLEWDENGLISMFELLAEFELPEPLIFNRQYQ
jgi:hypothetical protein